MRLKMRASLAARREPASEQNKQVKNGAIRFSPLKIKLRDD